MIKINLLESVTDRPTGAVMVEAKVATPIVQTLLLAMTVFGLLIVGMGYDYISTTSARRAAQAEVENQRRINQQMQAVNAERAELEKKTQDIQGRIDAIKKLREAQQGPSAVLRDIKTRFDAIPGLYLKSVEQKEGELTIKGLSPNEASVTRFGQSLEFSSGLFSNLNIETTRELASAAAPDKNATQVAAGESVVVVQPEVISFVVKCNYGIKPQAQNGNAPANQVALKK